MKTQLKIGFGLVALLFVFGTAAKADNIHIGNCTPVCVSNAFGSGSQGINSSNPTFSISNTGTTGLKGITTGKKPHQTTTYSGTMYLSVLIPGATNLGFKVNGIASGSPTMFSSPSKFLFTTLGMSGGNPANLSAFASITHSVVPSFTTKLGYSVFDFSLGAYNFAKNGGPLNVAFTMFTNGLGFPKGTVFFAFLRDNNNHGVIVDQTPFSEAAFTTKAPRSPVPEPGTLGLFGSGALALAGLIRRKIA